MSNTNKSEKQLDSLAEKLLATDGRIGEIRLTFKRDTKLQNYVNLFRQQEQHPKNPSSVICKVSVGFTAAEISGTRHNL